MKGGNFYMESSIFYTTPFESFFETYVISLGIGYYIFSIALAIFEIVCVWKVYEKASKPGWASIIPIYSTWVLFEICGFSGALSLLIFIPVIGWIAVVILTIVCYFRLAESFGKSSSFGVGLWFLNPIFMSILAFDNSTYSEVE